MYKDYPTFNNYEVLEYNRKSRSDDPLLSLEEVLEKHGKILEEYAEKYLGGPIPKENKYKEVASSETIDDRPEMKRLLRTIENPQIKAVLVVEVQRLSRGDLEDAGRLIKILRYTNTYVITPMKIYDLRDDYDRDAFERELKRGNEYLEYFKKIQARGTLASVKDGNYVGSVAPYGYERVKIRDGKRECFTLVEKKDEADIVRLIFQWYCNEGVGAISICRRLEEMNIKTKTGRDSWSPSMVLRILENVHYIGCVHWNWRKTVNIIEDSEIRKTRPKAKINEYLIFEGKHEGLVSEEIFNRAAEIRGSKPTTKIDVELRNPFSGIMYCKRCGHKLRYNSYSRNGVTTSAPKLLCSNQKNCKSGSVRFTEVLDYVCNALEDCIADFEVRVDTNKDDSVKFHKDLIHRLEKRLHELEQREVEQWKAQYDPDPSKRLPQHIFQKLNEEVVNEKREVEQALCSAKDSMPQPVDYKEKALKFKDALIALKDPEIPTKIKNRYLKDIIDRIEYDRPPLIRITRDNADQYGIAFENKVQYHSEPYKITIKIKS